MLSPYDLWLIKEWPIDVQDYVDKYWAWATPMFSDGQIYRSDYDGFDKYQGKKILIVGGGPSTNNLKDGVWCPALSEHNYVWSCNHYYLCEKLYGIHIDLAMIMPGVNTRNKEFLDRLSSDYPLIGIELHDRWFQSEKLREFCCSYGNDRMFFSHTRFFGKLGVGARMLILAASLGAKKVSFIGFDGPVKGHSFQKDKYELPSQVNQEEAWKIYKYQYDELYKHLAEFYPHTEIESLDNTNELHRMVW